MTTVTSETQYTLTGNTLQDIAPDNIVADDANGYYGEIIDVINDIVDIDWYEAGSDHYVGSTEIHTLNLYALTQDATVNIYEPYAVANLSSLERTLKTALSAIASVF